MPQFDFPSYLSQIFWFTIFFLVFFITVSKYLLPNLASTMKFRRKLKEKKAAIKRIPATKQSNVIRGIIYKTFF